MHERADFSFDEIEDIKVASAEACTLLLAENPEEIEVTINYGSDSFCVTLTANEPARQKRRKVTIVSELSQYLLEALVDRCELQRKEGDIIESIIIYKD